MTERRRDQKGRILRSGESQRPDGKYMFRYTDASGMRRTVYSWKLVETDAVPAGKKMCRALRDLEKTIQRDRDDDIRTHDADRVTVDDLFEAFMKLRTDLKESTRCNYTVLYNAYARKTIGSKTLKKVRFSDVQKLYIDMIREQHLKAGTVQALHSLLYQMFETAVMDKLIRDNPTANALKRLRRMFHTEQDQRHALTVQEQEELIRYVHRSGRYRRMAPLVTVLLGTGMRIGEALGLRWSDCDFEEGIIHVDHALLYKLRESGGYGYRISETKTRTGIRDIPMLDAVREELLEAKRLWQEDADHPFEVDGYKDFIFLNSSGKVFTQGAVFEIIRNLVNDHNEAELLAAEQEHRAPVLLPKFSAHILRHTFCTRLCENGTNVKVVQDVMGHKNIRTTMDVYNEATGEQKRKSFREIEEKLPLLPPETDERND